MKTVAKKVPGLVLLAVALFGLYLAGAWKADRASWPSLVPAMALGLPLLSASETPVRWGAFTPTQWVRITPVG